MITSTYCTARLMLGAENPWLWPPPPPVLPIDVLVDVVVVVVVPTVMPVVWLPVVDPVVPVLLIGIPPPDTATAPEVGAV